jgi:peptidyl-dipeptidase A
MTMIFQEFLNDFIPKLKQKETQVKRASWILETTGSEEAALLTKELTNELNLIFQDKETFKTLLSFEKEPLDPILKRELNVLIRAFKPRQIDKELLEEITKEEIHLALLYSNFRPTLDGKQVSENEIKEILKKEKDFIKRKKAWEASKEIGKTLSPQTLKLVELRNKAAKSLGYDTYFSMQLDLQEVDEKALFALLDRFEQKTRKAYLTLLDEINTLQAKEFNAEKESLGPLAFAEPFCQEDPLNREDLDSLVKNVDILKTAELFYKKMGFDVSSILKKGDHFERDGKNQHAFCTHIDREADVRVLHNIKQTLKWLEVVLHELGHAVYDIGISQELPWILREPPHMITTEAIALIAGRQAHKAQSLHELCKDSDKTLREMAEKGLKRGQLIFGRWALLMTYFERELYKNPNQDLNQLWWNMVERFQGIKWKGSSHKCDFATKYHISLAPAYYFSYLLGEFFASTLQKKFNIFSSENTALILNEKLFKPGNTLHFNDLIKQVTGDELKEDDWIEEFLEIDNV